jgi:hypothetical protein
MRAFKDKAIKMRVTATDVVDVVVVSRVSAEIVAIAEIAGTVARDVDSASVSRESR